MLREINIGERFGRLVVISEEVARNRHNDKIMLCQCDCGSEPKWVRVSNLLSGGTQSCGCLKIERVKQMGINNTKHFGCMECGSDKHYAKGLCAKCYNKKKRREKKENGN